MSNPIPRNIGRPAKSALEAANISSLEDLSNISESELAQLHGVGPKATSILKRSLAEKGMCLISPEDAKPNE